MSGLSLKEQHLSVTILPPTTLKLLYSQSAVKWSVKELSLYGFCLLAIRGDLPCS